MSKLINFMDYKKRVRNEKIKKQINEVFYRAIGVVHKNKDFILLAIPIFDLILQIINLKKSKED